VGLFWECDSGKILQGDVLDELRTLPDESVHCVVTSPPYYGLRDYGTGTWEGGDPSCKHESAPVAATGNKGNVTTVPVRGQCACGAVRIDRQIGLEPTLGEYLSHMVDVFREVRRVLRSDGTCWVNMGDSYVTKPNGRSNDDPRRVLVDDRTFRANVPVDIDTTKTSGLPAKSLMGVPWRLAFALQDDGWLLRSDIIWSKPNPMPESIRDRPTKAHEYVFLFAKRQRYYWDQEGSREVSIGPGGHARPELKQKYGDDPRHRTKRPCSGGMGGDGLGRNPRSVWTIATQSFSDAHFATYPEALVQRCLQAGTSDHGACARCGAPYRRIVEKGAALAEWQRACGADASGGYNGNGKRTNGVQTPGDVKARVLAGMVEKITKGWEPTCKCEAADPVPCVVLDPFFGSGTTGLVAAKMGRRFIGIDLNRDYCDLAARRIRSWMAACQSELQLTGVE